MFPAAKQQLKVGIKFQIIFCFFINTTTLNTNLQVKDKHFSPKLESLGLILNLQLMYKYFKISRAMSLVNLLQRFDRGCDPSLNKGDSTEYCRPPLVRYELATGFE